MNPLVSRYASARCPPFIGLPIRAKQCYIGSISRTYNSLSAIHRGLRRSVGDPLQRKHAKRLRKAAREGDEEQTGRASRAKRFNDPTSNFGKRSLVYRLKFGDLSENRDAVAQKTDRESQSPPAPAGSFQSLFDSRLDSRRGDGRQRPLSRNRQDVRSSRLSHLRSRERPNLEEHGTPRNRLRRAPTAPEEESNREPGWHRGRPLKEQRQSAFMQRSVPTTSQGESSGEVVKSHRRQHLPLSIKYTTPASQFLYGTGVVRAAMTAGKRKMYNLYLAEGSKNESGALRRQAQKLGVPVTILPRGGQSQMDKMSMGRPHNGAILEASPLAQPPIKALGESDHAKLQFVLDWQSKEDAIINGHETSWKLGLQPRRYPFVLLLHEVVDPGNLGSILRSARFLGASAVGITKHASTSLTPVVLKAAAGASEEMHLFTVNSPAEFIQSSAKAGWVSYAACPGEDGPGNTRHLTMSAVSSQDPLRQHPCILVLGNEGQGLPTVVTRASSYAISIPATAKSSTVDSLNVSVAAALLCHAFLQAQERKPSIAAANQISAVGDTAAGSNARSNTESELW